MKQRDYEPGEIMEIPTATNPMVVPKQATASRIIDGKPIGQRQIFNYEDLVVPKTATGFVQDGKVIKVGCSVDVDKAWIQTAGGGIFHILDPRQNEILITDIGHALSMMCRFTGHVRRFYSVAEHSVLASRIVPQEDALWALLHDASEAYIADLNRPLKHYTAVGPTYMGVEEKIMKAVCLKFHLSETQPESVHKADTMMLYAEKEQLMPAKEWGTKWSEDQVAADVEVRCWAPDVAKTMFMHRFYQLTEQL
jgi:hypothetical protein